MWSLTTPTFCMNAYTLVGPTKRYPCDFNCFANASVCGVDLGRLDRPGDLGGSDSWEDAEPCQHSGSIPRSCASARSRWCWRSAVRTGRAGVSSFGWPGSWVDRPGDLGGSDSWE